jgi:hypothetical protein
MGFATHLGPWLLGTIKDTTGTTVGNIRNTGATMVAQTVQLNMVGATSAAAITCFTLPAGAHIVDFVVDTLTTLSGTVTAAVITIGTSTTANLFYPSTTILTAGRQSPTLTTTQVTAYSGASSTAAPNGIGIGPTDVIVVATPTFTTGSPSTAGLIQITCRYIVADSTGALVQSATQA